MATQFTGELWTVSEGARDKYGLRWIFGADQQGLSSDPNVLHTGRNSGFQAINLAYLMGATRVLLLGFDMQATGGRSHWHGDHPPGLSNARRRYAAWRTAMEALAADMNRTTCKVWNCSRVTALQGFERKKLEEALTC